MADVDVVAIPAQIDYSTFDDLRLGRSSQDVVGRLLRFWDARNIKKLCIHGHSRPLARREGNI